MHEKRVLVKGRHVRVPPSTPERSGNLPVARVEMLTTLVRRMRQQAGQAVVAERKAQGLEKRVGAPWLVWLLDRPHSHGRWRYGERRFNRERVISLIINMSVSLR